MAAAAPRNRLNDRPAARALAVELELRAEPIEPIERVASAVAELRRTDDWRDGELPLGGERFRVDREPRLPLRREHVFAVEVLVDENELALRRRELTRQCARRVAEATAVP